MESKVIICRWQLADNWLKLIKTLFPISTKSSFWMLKIGGNSFLLHELLKLVTQGCG